MAKLHLFDGDSAYELTVPIDETVQQRLNAGARASFTTWYALLGMVVDLIADAQEAA